MGRRTRTNTVTGLNIEPGGISAAQVSVNGSISVLRGARVALDAGVVRDGEVADAAALADALRELWRGHKGLDKRVRIGVANARIVVRTLDLPPIEDRKELEAAVRFRAQDEIAMPLDSAVLDFHPLGIVETPQGPRQRVVLVAARRDMIGAVLAATRAAGLRPEGIDLSAFALIRALRVARPGPALFLWVGGLTNLAISDEGACAFTRVAGGGLEALAVELAERRELALEQARDLLFEAGLPAAPPVAVLPTAIPTEFSAEPQREADPAPEVDPLVADAQSILADGVRRIAAEVRASLDFHHTQGDAGLAVERVVLGGPAVAVPGFGAALQADLGMPVEDRVVGGDLSPLDAARLSVAAGLAVEAGAA